MIILIQWEIQFLKFNVATTSNFNIASLISFLIDWFYIIYAALWGLVQSKVLKLATDTTVPRLTHVVVLVNNPTSILDSMFTVILNTNHIFRNMKLLFSMSIEHPCWLKCILQNKKVLKSITDEKNYFGSHFEIQYGCHLAFLDGNICASLYW